MKILRGIKKRDSQELNIKAKKDKRETTKQERN